MQFARLVELTADLNCFSPGMLAAAERIDRVRVQLSRWVQNGRIVRIHKGWYALAAPYRRGRIDTTVIACTIKPGSYVSLQSALSAHDMIPEHVAVTTCVTTGRPLTIDTPFGRIRYRHIKRDAFFGYARVSHGVEHAYVAVPEKALLDLLYLTPGSVDVSYLTELRLERVGQLDLEVLRQMAGRFDAPRLERVDALIRELALRQGASA